MTRGRLTGPLTPDVGATKMKHIGIMLSLAMIPMIASSDDFTNSLHFIDSIQVMTDRIIVTENDRIGRLPAGKKDIPDNIIYSQTNVYYVGDCIRSQGGQHNCYWDVQAISNRFVKLRFFGHIRGFGTQDRVFWTSEEMKEEPQPWAGGYN